MRKTTLLLLLALSMVPLASPAIAAPGFQWPVVGPVIRSFDLPGSQYAAGHRGVDVAAPVGTVLLAAAEGTVSFAGPVAGRLYVTIDHGGGWLSTVSFLTTVLVRKGDQVLAGDPIATSGWGHADALVPHVHFGIRWDGVYVDPMSLLPAPDVSSFIRLGPLEPITPA